MLLAASTQRTVGFVILAIVFLGGLVYLFFNIRGAKAEVGSEIELAPNRSEPIPDEELEGRRLDLNLGAALVMLAMIGVMLPVYWLGEPGRHEGREVDTARIFTNRGEELYTEGAQCVNCHGAAGSGGAVSTALTDDAGDFIAQVSWKAPALDTVLSRFSEDEVLHTLNFGRNGVMPAWGAPGGGPLTTQQLEEIIHYLRSIQIGETSIRDAVTAGVRFDYGEKLVSESDEDWAVAIRDAEDSGDEQAVLDATAAAADAIETATDDWLAEIDEVLLLAREMAIEQQPGLLEGEAPTEGGDSPTDVEVAGGDPTSGAESAAIEASGGAQPETEAEAVNDDVRRAALELLSQPGEVPGQEVYWEYGEILFANSAAGGTYGCARCHTFGWSYDAASDFTIEENGTDGPLLPDGYDMGCGFFGPSLCGGATLNQFATAAGHSDFITTGQNIGQTYGVGGSGGNGQMPGFGPRTDDDLGVDYAGMLTQDQIDAVVAYERNL